MPPPRIATALLAACLPPGTVRESVLGDLHEAFLNLTESGQPSRTRLCRAMLWYWREAFGLGVRYLLRRFARPRSLPRHSLHKPVRKTMMNDFFKDIRFASRLFVRSPGFSVATVLVLAIGIGAVSAMFSTLHSVVLRPLPYEDPRQLVWAWGSSEQIPSNSVSALDYWDYREQADVFESLGAVLVFAPRAIISGGDEPERVLTTRVSHNFFSVLGSAPQIGRSFLPEEEQAGAANVVVISDGFWKRRYAGSRGIVGKTVTISGQPYQVIGVMPPGFEFRRQIELWYPMQREADFTRGRGNNNFNIVGRLRQGASIEAAQQQIDTIARRLEETYPQTNEGWGLRLEPLHETFVGDARASLVMLLGLVGLVLLIACANAASLFLARAMTRSTEVALRLSLGAARWRVIRQLLTESGLVALVGGAVGLLLAYLGISALKSLGPPGLPRLESIGIDATVLAVTLTLSLLASLAFGIVPALRGTNLSLSETLKAGGARGSGHRRAGLRNALVVAQVALSLMLMIASGLLMQSYLRLQGVEAGFNAEHVLRAELQLPEWKYGSRPAIEQAWSDLHERLRALPAVTSVGAIDQAPIRSGGTWNTIYPADRPPKDAAQRAQFGAERRFASDDYFSTMGIPILMGRALQPSDRLGSSAVVVISDTMAQQYFPDESPLGKELVLWRRNFEVVGVAGDVREFGLAEGFPKLFYLPSRQATPSRMELLIRTSGDPLQLAAALRKAVWEIDAEIPISGLQTMESRISGSLARPRFRTFLVGMFAATALLLALMGLYGVLAFFVRQRHRELGIRIALGASPGKIIGLVVRKGMTMVGIGIGLGILGGFTVGRLMQSLLFEVAATDAFTFGGVSLCLAAVTLAACIVPALRAVKVDPQQVLRVE